MGRPRLAARLGTGAAAPRAHRQRRRLQPVQAQHCHCRGAHDQPPPCRPAGNVTVAADAAGLESDSVVNVTQLATVDRAVLEYRIAALPDWLMAQVDAGLARALALHAR